MSSIVVGTNVFVDCETPLEIDRAPLIQVSTDAAGDLRLTVQINSPPANRPLRVNSNVVEVGDAVVSKAADSVEVHSSGSTIVAARRVGDVVHVRLDLRPLGVFIFSDDRALHVGASVFSGNTIAGARTGIALATSST